MSDKVIIHVVNAASDRGDLWTEVQRQNALIHELREAVHVHAQTIRNKQAVIDDTQKRLATSEWQTAEWTAQANQLTVANNQKADRIIELVERVRDAEHLCKWLLQSDISDADRERVIRENGINFSIALCSPEPKP